ncbi:transcription termination/antitermination protein NusG [Granulosicoccaceae sp. 1_MG-2023]|nr:transcription termination/antitermination protein NusG [Granulosicoccaceae sp. 1_MG-2023]
MAKRWYVVQAFSGFEKSVKKSLEERIERFGMQEKFDEVVVPTEEVVEMRAGKQYKSERKFFPGYVLVRMEMDEETWHLVKDVPRVLGFIGDVTSNAKEDGKPKVQPITDKEADAIMQRVQDGVEKPRPKVLFEVGEVVRVIDGPFNDFNAVVEEVNFEKSRLMVAVQIFGRSTPVEIEFEKVEKV